MALVKTSNQISTIRGRCGGVYFKRDTSGRHVQTMPRSVRYTRSPAQQGQWESMSPFLGFGIKGFSGAAAFWLLALLGFYAAAWAEFAILYFFASDDGEKKRITGYNWYIYYALAFPECERPPFWQPPHSPGELPDYISTYQGTWTYEHSPLEWPEWCPAGYYWYRGEWNYKPSYRTDDYNYYIWWNGTVWVQSKILGLEEPTTTFYSPGTEISARYYNPVQKKYSHVYLGKPPG